MESRPVSRFTGLHVHFIGIGGCGMAGLARMLLDAGAVVSGSDLKPTVQTQALAYQGATISYAQDGSLLNSGIDLVVRTAAIPDTNPEYRRALELNLAQLKYAQLLGQVMQERLGIAISGTHGKSTTTSMLSFALLQCGADPSFVIGGTVPQLDGSSRSGQGDAFVVEACEFDRSFHNYHPRVAVITNIEADHLDCYPGGLPEIIQSFRHFAQLVPPAGKIIANGQDANVAAALRDIRAPIETVAVFDPSIGQSPPPATWLAMIKGHTRGQYQADVLYQDRRVAELQLSLAGVHNVFNATAALAACRVCNVDLRAAANAIGRFAGVDRRMAEVGRYNGAVIVDDYGHHPTEIKTTLRAARQKYGPRRLICVFQPHQYSRTRYLLDDFATSFADADLTILPEIYAARDSDQDLRSVSAGDLVGRIVNNGRNAVHLAKFPQIVEYLRQEARQGDLIITMGAGNVCDIGRQLVQIR